MLFNTIQFIVFFPIVIFLYYLIPHKYRWGLLLAASYYFYMSWKLEYIVLIISSTLIDYYSAIQIEKKDTKKGKMPFLILSLLMNFGLLFSFKYFNFFSESVQLIAHQFSLSFDAPIMHVLLPVGISFYTFQTLSYTLDVYNGKQKAERHLGYFALYVSFFPQLVAGPIERFSRLTPQFKVNHPFTYENFVNGMRLILYGLFIKMVIADNLSGIVDLIYTAPETYNSADILLGFVFYSFQIYADFFGYSSVAIGSALIMGIKIMDNFKTPYLATNIAEFWQRWHISLSTWFRDYLYFPMGGSKVKKFRWIYNIIVVFVVSGLWHGANTTFIIWGALYALVYLLEKAFNSIFKIDFKPQGFSWIQILLATKTFIFVSFIWVFFRSQSFTEAIEIVRLSFTNFEVHTATLNVPIRVWVMLTLFFVSDLLLYNRRVDLSLGELPMGPRWMIYSVLIFSIIVFSGVDNFPFIYFQF